MIFNNNFRKGQKKFPEGNKKTADAPVYFRTNFC